MNAEVYYEKLRNEPNKASVLVRMYLELFGESKFNLHQIFNKLLKGYGEDLTFFSLLDMFDGYETTLDNSKSPYPLLAFFAKRRLEIKRDGMVSKDLSKVAETVEKSLKKKVKEVKNPFEDENG